MGIDAGSAFWQDVGHLGESDGSMAWRLSNVRPQVDADNAQLLDAVVTVLQYYPRTFLQVHAVPPKVMQLPPALAAALRLPAVDRGAKHPPEVLQEGLTRLARKRAEAIVGGLVERGVQPQRLVATAPGADLGMQSTGLFTIHQLPSAIKLDDEEDDLRGNVAHHDPWDAPPGTGRAAASTSAGVRPAIELRA